MTSPLRSFVEESLGVLLSGILLVGSVGVWKGSAGAGRGKVLTALLSCLEKAGGGEAEVWNVAREWGGRMAEAAAETRSCEAATSLLYFVSAAVWGEDGRRLTSFAKSKAKNKRNGMDEVLMAMWPMVTALGAEYGSMGVDEKETFGALCNAAVYHWVEGEDKEGPKAAEKGEAKPRAKVRVGREVKNA